MFKPFNSRVLYRLCILAGFLLFVVAPNTPGQLIISEFRLRGPDGVNDEFIELYNGWGTDQTVNSQSPSQGYSVAGSNGSIRCIIPNGTVIPGGGHYLCVNSVAYSLGSYASGNSSYTANIPENSGIAVFNNTLGGASFNLANRLDAVGSTTEANTLYKEGAGYPAISSIDLQQTFYRKTNDPGGEPKDTNDNAADFAYANTQGVNLGMGGNLGNPSPKNLSSPIQRNRSFLVFDAICQTPCARVRSTTAVANGALGTISLRRKITNNTGANVTRMRFRIVDLSTFGGPTSAADLRLLTSNDMVLNVIDPGGGTTVVSVFGLTLDNPSGFGGGHNSSASVGVVTLGTPIPPGSSIYVNFLLGVEKEGDPRFNFMIEVLP